MAANPAEVLSQFEFCFLSKASSHSMSFSSEDALFFRKLLPSLRKLPQSKPLGCVLGICALFRYVPRGPGLGASASMIARMSSRGNAHDFDGVADHIGWTFFAFRACGHVFCFPIRRF